MQIAIGDTGERLRPAAGLSEKQTLPEFVLSFEQIEEIIDAALPRAAHRASWWETLRSPQEKMPQREACLAAATSRRGRRTARA